MAKKLDAERIEKVGQKGRMINHREEEKRRIQETIAKNRSGERKCHVIVRNAKCKPMRRLRRCAWRHTAVSAPLKKLRLAVSRCKCSISNPL